MWIATLPISGYFRVLGLLGPLVVCTSRVQLLGFNKFYNTRSTALPCIAARSGSFLLIRSESEPNTLSNTTNLRRLTK